MWCALRCLQCFVVFSPVTWWRHGGILFEVALNVNLFCCSHVISLHSILPDLLSAQLGPSAILLVCSGCTAGFQNHCRKVIEIYNRAIQGRKYVHIERKKLVLSSLFSLMKTQRDFGEVFLY